MSDSTIPKPASKSKRVKSFAAMLIAVCVFCVALTKVPFIGQNQTIQIVAGVAAALSGFVGTLLGILDSGTKIDFNHGGK